jgi:hypothetical protein
MSGGILWGRISINLAECLEVKSVAREFSRLMGVSKTLISQWKHFEKILLFQKVLEICYAAGISPLQLMIDAVSMMSAVRTLADQHKLTDWNTINKCVHL